MISTTLTRLTCGYDHLAAVNQSLPAVDSLNTSLYFVNAGFQDYFFPLYYKNLTTSEALDLVDSVVDAIITAVKVICFTIDSPGRHCEFIGFVRK